MKYILSLLLSIVSISLLMANNQSDNIGQVMMVGMKGTSVNENSDIVQQMKKYKIGGIVLFPKTEQYPDQNIENAKQLQKLTKDLHFYAEKYGIPKLLIAVNEEGGVINGLKPEKFPLIKQCADTGLNKSQKDIGNLGDIALANKQSKCIGEALKSYGIDINFAPVAAIEINPESEVIAKWGRSYGNNIQQVTEFLNPAIKGYKETGIIPVMKHFPGLGSAKANTDFGGMVNISDTWQEQEGDAYRNLISSGDATNMIMVSFAMNTNLDKSGLPAALSYKMVTNLLRNDMKYDGLIMTDDLNASAIMDYFSRKQATYLAINAGNNMLIFGGGLGYDATQETDTLYKNLKELYESDPAFKEKVDKSVDKILEFKKSIN